MANKQTRLPADDSPEVDHQDADDKSAQPHEERKLSRGHDSRVDELSEERATHQERPVGPWIRPSSLHAPDPRPGMVQRWIRISVRGAEDPRNVNMRTREGWRPRDASTIPDDFAEMGSRAGLSEGRFIVDDLMLCEMPKAVYQQQRDYYQGLTDSQMSAVEHDLENAQVPGQPIVRTHKTSVTHPARQVGRRVEAAEDD